MSVAIVGAGLSGLFLARLLQQQGIDYQIYEARNRTGGRILSKAGKDLGPTWYWPDDNPELVSLIDELQLENFPQWTQGLSLYQREENQTPQSFQDPQGYTGAQRLAGGMGRLVEALQAQLQGEILFQHQVLKISQPSQKSEGSEGVELQIRLLDDKPSSVSAENARLSYLAEQVVLCLPPRLIAEKLEFVPKLEEQLHKMLAVTPTWMAGQAKAMLGYELAFWRPNDLCGSAFAAYPSAIVGEVFDACGPQTANPALGAFFALPPNARQQSREKLTSELLAQLGQLFGEAASQPNQLLIQDWVNEPFTSTVADREVLNFHPMYGHTWLELDHWQDRLFFCGSETARRNGGYLEGALVAAKRVAQSIILSKK